MSKKPYPGYPPNLLSVHQTGGYHRRCMVLEFLTLDKLTSEEEAQIYEAIEMSILTALRGRQNVEKFKLISQDSFDTLLLEGLRLRSI